METYQINPHMKTWYTDGNLTNDVSGIQEFVVRLRSNQSLTDIPVVAKTLRYLQIISKLGMECLKRLNILGLAARVWFLLILGHIGIEENAMAE